MKGTSHIGPRTRVEGRLESRGEVELHGSLDGEVQAERLLIHERGALVGEARAQRILVRGRARAELLATQLVELEVSAKVEGTLSADRVLIADGADFRGRVHMKKPRSGRDEDDEL